MNEIIDKNSSIPTYEVFKQKFSPEEKVLLKELRENLVDLAISSGENFQINETKLLNDIKNFLFSRLASESGNLSNEYIDSLSKKLLQSIIGYGQIDSLVHDDDLEEVMVIGLDKPVFVYHRKYGMMKIRSIPCMPHRPMKRHLCLWVISVFTTDIQIWVPSGTGGVI